MSQTRLVVVAAAISGASPRAQRLIAFAAGVFSILAMAPFHFWPVLWLTLPVFLLTLDTATLDTANAMPLRVSRWAPWRRSAIGRAAECGWWFGFGYHLVGLFWIGEAFLIEADVFGWLLPLAVTLMPAGLALFTAIAAATVQAAQRSAAIDRIVVCAIAFGLTEWLRGHILTGFPWNVLGYALTWPLSLMQSASVFGIYGLTCLTVLIFAAPYAALTPDRGERHAPWLIVQVTLLVLASLFVFGHWRLASHPIATDGGPRPMLRVVQASVPQRERLDPANIRRIFDQHLALSRTAPDGTIDDAVGIDVIVWPEAAMPFLPLAQPIALEEIGRLLGGKAQLVAGALRAEPSARPGGGRDVYNSLLVFDGGLPARHVGTYDKIHLVPFGEYLPAQSFLETIGLQQLTRQRGGFAAGTGPRKLLAIKGLGQVLPLICYEAVFPGLLTPAAGRADLLLTLTNDGWFGTATGPRQHYHQGRVRAIETGVPLLRASSNGISAMVDPLGREQARIELNAIGTFDAAVPVPLSPPVYARWGDGIFVGLLVSLALILLIKRMHFGTETCQ
jgi:apolipoprotein N-acyltransferase